MRNETNLASSSLADESSAGENLIGVLVSYSVRVKVHMTAFGGELAVDVPFKLLHPKPGTTEEIV